MLVEHCFNRETALFFFASLVSHSNKKNCPPTVSLRKNSLIKWPCTGNSTARIVYIVLSSVHSF